MKDKVAIVGMGCSKFGERWDCSIEDLIVEAVTEGLEDAGMGKEDVDALFYSSSFITGASAVAVDALKLDGIPAYHNENWCCSGHIALIQAAMAVACGVYNTVLVLGAEKLKDTGAGGLGVGRGNTPVMENRRTAPGSFGLIGQRYFHEYGLTYEEGRRALARIAVKNHANGYLSPKAHFHKIITMEDALNAPVIAAPLGLYDCCGTSDGASCAIITRTDMAKSVREDPVYIKGFGVSHGCMPHYDPAFDWLHFPALKRSSQAAYEMAGITNPREELSLAEVHDCFTVTELAIYENFDFCDEGTAHRLLQEGYFDRDGKMPVNVDGGLKCFGHPVGASGIRMTYELYKQLQRRVDNPERQLKGDLRLGLSHTFGGPPQLSAVLVVGNEPG
ncbi:MAG: acetyl-CoA acetyltransferase [Clostridium sp.]|nr:acetyl-CoA acetyltransferase [Clostridium sp.]